MVKTTDNPTIQAIKADPREFRRQLRIQCGHEPRRLGEVAEPWQERDFVALDDSWRAVIGHDVKPKYRRGYLERPRGHSKTGDIATMATCAIFSAPRKISGIVAAGTKEQAKLTINAIDMLVRLNPHLAAVLEIQLNRVVNRKTGSELRIISSDAYSSFGELVDFIICDELTHWPSVKGEKLWAALFSAAAKKPHCLLIIISNAGNMKGAGWQWKNREAIRQDPAWYFSRLDGPAASWISAEQLAEQRRLLPESVYQRLWMNLWITGAGDALDMRLVEAAVTLPGETFAHRDDWYPMLAGLDLGIKHDHSALVTLGVDIDAGRLKLASAQAWKPEDYTGEVNLADIEAAVLDTQRRYNLAGVYYDPHQAAYLAQRLRERGVNMTHRTTRTATAILARPSPSSTASRSNTWMSYTKTLHCKPTNPRPPSPHTFESEKTMPTATLTKFIDLHESVTAMSRIDREAGIVRDVRICGLKSRNGRTYTAAALRDARPLYEGVKVFIDHPDHRTPNAERKFDDLFATLRNVRMTDNGLRGDLHYLTSHPKAEQFAEAVEKMSSRFGLSHNIEAELSRRDGKTLVEKIIDVRSVDLVTDPATSAGLFESRRQGNRTMKNRLTKALREVADGLELGLGDVEPETPDTPGTTDEMAAEIQQIVKDNENPIDLLAALRAFVKRMAVSEDEHDDEKDDEEEVELAATTESFVESVFRPSDRRPPRAKKRYERPVAFEADPERFCRLIRG
ncbi:MAG: hypothetical protein IID44_04945 [Planctomycetes bacterium]|nr:hypothetical protein [Planctomycetota bacterium]